MAKQNYNLKDHKLWREIILEKFNRECVICQSTNRLTAHHLISSRIKEFRFNENNGIALCSRHHTYYDGPLSPHNDSAIQFFIWLLNNHPKVVKWVEDNCDEV